MLAVGGRSLEALASGGSWRNTILIRSVKPQDQPDRGGVDLTAYGLKTTTWSEFGRQFPRFNRPCRPANLVASFGIGIASWIRDCSASRPTSSRSTV
jgi:hypothetical protein